MIKILYIYKYVEIICRTKNDELFIIFTKITFKFVYIRIIIINNNILYSHIHSIINTLIRQT